MRCWGQDYCKKYNTELCTAECDLYLILKCLYKNSNMPLKYQYDIPLSPVKEDLEAYKKLNTYKINILENIDNGLGLYIYSATTGNGKTTWSTKIMNYYFRKIVFTTLLENEGYYINLASFLESLRLSYENNTTDLLVDKVVNAKLLIIDDIGAEKVSDWTLERLYSIINERVVNNRATIYTSNLSPQQLISAVGNRIVSRILGSCEVVELKGADRRLKNV